MPDITDTDSDTTDTDSDTMESVLLKPSPRLLLIPTSCMEDMDMGTTWDIVDIMDTHTHITTMARDLLKLSLRLKLTPTFSMEDMDMDTLDTVDTTDTHMVDMPTTDKLCRHKPYPAIANGQINHLCLLLQ